MNVRRVLRVGGIVSALALLTSSCALTRGLAKEKPQIPPLPQTSLMFDDKGNFITSLHAGENRTLVPIANVPHIVRNAVIAIEDKGFYSHHGVDLKAIIRAAYENAKSGKIVQGGSTITEQLIKNTITGDDRTLNRKVREAVLAYQLENEWSKDRILQEYLNTVYFGEGAYGVEAAAQTYFDRPAKRLTLAQGALLAGLISSPASWDPVFHPKAARERRDQVLAIMLKLNMITRAAYEKASSRKVTLKLSNDRNQYAAAYFVDYVKRWFLGNPRFGATRQARYDRLFSGGLRIHTTVDLRLQKYAEDAINSILTYKNDPYGAMTVVDPRSGAIKAMVGGRNFFRGKFSHVNLATGDGGTGRQAGSAFKPFTLVTALQEGIPPQRTYPAPPSLEIPLPPGSVPPVWSVGNYDPTSGGGTLTIEQATIFSVNTVYAQIIMDAGPDNVVRTAKAMGITSKLRAVPSAVLGTNEVNTLEMASAFGTLATVGGHTPPIAVSKITDAAGQVIFQARPRLEQVVNPGVAWTVDQILQKVIQQGTGVAANIGRPAGGKTGTAQQWRDAWFVGFIPQLVAAVWVGFPQGQISMVSPTVRIYHVLGGTWPAQIWHAFMVNATRNLPVQDFAKPDVNFVSVRVDVTRNCLPNQWTLPKDIETVQFIAGTEPKKVCKEPTGPQLVTVPSVVGLSKSGATSTLQSYGFKVGVKEKNAPSAAPGTVLSQSPSAGTSAYQGSTVTITVASGRSPPPSTATVPNVVGKSRGDASSRLRSAGFSVAVIERWQCHPPDSCGAQPNVVWQQSPGGGSKAKLGSTVTIWVNKSRGTR
jgi:membrane peptidoglycan carboxypeptidase